MACSFPEEGQRTNVCSPTVKLSKQKWSKQWKQIPYVRHGMHKRRTLLKRAKWSWSMNEIQALGDQDLVLKMTADGFLKNWAKHTCPHCGKGRVAPLAKIRATWQYR